MNQSPLHDWHAQAGGKMIDFYGWQLPVQYSSIIEEHNTVRKAAGLFDISHMGQVLVQGPDAFSFLQKLITNDLERLRQKSLAVYGHLCLPTGGVIDDIYIYGSSERETYFVVVNSSTHEKDVAWFRKQASGGVTITDLTGRAGFAIQGPKALEIIRSVIAGVAELPRFAYQQLPAPSIDRAVWACRTGYTGEEGAEFFGPAKDIQLLWKQLYEAGQPYGLKPCGLGARDTLRLEVGYPLYGHELDESHTPFESNLPWVVKLNKDHFIGKEALEQQKKNGTPVLLQGFELLDRGIPRQGYNVWIDGKNIGPVASGTFSPTLQKGIGTAFFPTAQSAIGTPIEIELAQKKVKAQICAMPFLTKTPAK